MINCECLIDGCGEARISEITAEQRQKIKEAKKRRDNTIPGICIVTDDMAHDRKAVRSSTLN